MTQLYPGSNVYSSKGQKAYRFVLPSNQASAGLNSQGHILQRAATWVGSCIPPQGNFIIVPSTDRCGCSGADESPLSWSSHSDVTSDHGQGERHFWQVVGKRLYEELIYELEFWNSENRMSGEQANLEVVEELKRVSTWRQDRKEKKGKAILSAFTDPNTTHPAHLPG